MQYFRRHILQSLRIQNVSAEECCILRVLPQTFQKRPARLGGSVQRRQPRPVLREGAGDLAPKTPDPPVTTRVRPLKSYARLIFSRCVRIGFSKLLLLFP